MNAVFITAMGLLLMLAVIITAGGVVRFSAFYRHELIEAGSRELTLDGLRGLAALLVVAYHSALIYQRLLTGKWGDAGSPVIQAFGPGGVLLFFMLTGYLFWSKARTQQGKFNVWKLWRGRLYRIGPLYLFSLGCVLVVALVENSGYWLTWANAPALSRLLPLGFCHWQPVGGLDLGNINNGVVWTLWYEWRFYLVLPFIAWLAVGGRTLWLALAAYIAVFLGLWFKLNLQPGLVFILGMLCPVLLDDQRLRSQLHGQAAAVIALTATIILSILNRSYVLSVLPSIALAAALFPLFLVVAAGNPLFGFLTLPAMRCLGAISYSLYLLHSIVFYVVVGVLKGAGWESRPLLGYWLVIALAAMAAACLCSVTYRWIEFPFLFRYHSTSNIANSRSGGLNFSKIKPTSKQI